MNAASLVERYRKVHRPGQDCRLTAARNLLELAGHRYTYAMVQGLSSSFYFTYRERASAHDTLLYPNGLNSHFYFSVAGHRREVLENLAYLSCAQLMTGEGQTGAQAEADMIAYVEAGMPVLVAVNRMTLARHFGQEAQVRFPAFLGTMQAGGHHLLVAGVDRARGVATVFDSSVAPPLQLPLAVLAQARTEGDGDPDCVMQSHRGWAVFVAPRQVPPLRTLMRQALVRTGHVLRNADLHSGLSGLHAFAAAMPGWAEHPEMTADKLRATMFIMELSSEKVAGGSLGRRGFGMFLRQAGDILRNDALLEAAGHYADLSLLWRELMDAMQERVFAAAGPRSLDTAPLRALLGRMLDLEQAGQDLLLRAVEDLQ